MILTIILIILGTLFLLSIYACLARSSAISHEEEVREYFVNRGDKPND